MKKFVLIILVIFISVQTNFLYAQSNYNVNFKNVPIKDFLTFVSEFTGKNMIYNEADIRGNITIESQQEMNSKEVLELFFSIMKLNGYIPIESGNNIQILSEKDLPLYDNDIRKGDVSGQSYITTVISLANYNTANIIPLLNRMKSRSGYIEAVRGLNLLIIRDMNSRVKSMRNMLAALDKEASSFKLYTIRLKSVTASRAEQHIKKFFGELIRNSLSTTTPSIVSDDMSNSLIVAAIEKDYERILYLVEQLEKINIESASTPKIYRLKNTKAEDVEAVLNKLLGAITVSSKDGTTTTQRATNSKATISADKATNSIIAMGDQAFYNSIDSLIEKMDIPRKQVYVEALILETTIDKGTQFGVEWFGGADGKNGAILGGLSNSGALAGLAGSVTQGTTPTLPGGFSVGIIGNIIQFGGMKFPSIGALVSALQSLSGINIVSNPQILTLDNEEAEVFVGENRPYVTSEKFDSNNNPIQTFDYRNVGIRLKITPQISSNNTITLSINQEVNKISPATFNATAPVTLTRTTKTTVKLADKSIMVISGLIKDDSSIARSEIPFISRIPILGWLFKTQNTSIEKTNMMIFITATIVHNIDDSNAILEKSYSGLEEFRVDADDIFGDDIFADQKFNIPLADEVYKKVDSIRVTNKYNSKNQDEE